MRYSMRPSEEDCPTSFDTHVTPTLRTPVRDGRRASVINLMTGLVGMARNTNCR